MASPSGDHSNYPHLQQHEETWKTFNKLAVWTIIGTVVLLAGMAFFLTGGHPPKPL
jgi:hypothetical protein